MGCFPVARERWGSMRDSRATSRWSRLLPGWPEEGRQREQAAVSGHGEVPAADSGRARAEEQGWGVRKLAGGSVRSGRDGG